ncbi:MAG: DNA adenine methylase [Roseburia sp.]|nr:DNA adenine methylase [Roseburia sp.]
MSAKETAEKWNISQRRVSVLCREHRIDGAVMIGNMWVIPSNAEKPVDKRTVRYGKKNAVVLKPFVKWAGGKGQLIGELEKMLTKNGERQFTKYCEPMVGGGALFFNCLSKYGFKEFYIGDTNAELINAYKVIRDDVSGLIKKLQEMQRFYLSQNENGRKTYYYAVRDKFNTTVLRDDTAVEKAAYFIFLNKTCFNGLYRVNRKGRFNVPIGSYSNPKICDSENLLNISRLLEKVTIVCGDYTSAENFIDKNTFVYFDPPYRPISETSAFNSYNSDIFDDCEQIRLSDFIGKLNANGVKFVLSNSDPRNVSINDAFFDELYGNYNIKRVSANRMINSKADKRGKINELIIYN